MSIKEAREMGGKAFKEQWGPSLLAVLLACAGMLVATVFVLGVGGMIALGPISVGLLYVYSKGLHGEKIEYLDMLVGFKNNFGEIVLASLLKAAFIFGISAAAATLIITFSAVFRLVPAVAVVLDVLVSIAAAVFIIIFALRLAAVEYIMMREPEGKGWEAVKKSNRIMSGNCGKMIGFTLSFIGWLILTALFFPIGVYTIPYYYMSRTAMLESIYEEAARKAAEAAQAQSAEGKKHCKHCGALIAEDSAFCSRCGKEQ